MSSKKDIIVVGAGPAGLVAAIDLNREGYNVIIREREDSVGGEPGWHPSVHSTPVDMDGLSEYIGIDITEAFVDTSENCRMVVGGQDLGIVDVKSVMQSLYNAERGHRPSSLDSILFRLAEKEGVHFEFKAPFTKEEFDRAPKNTIIATGLSPGMYEYLNIPHSWFKGYWAYNEIERDYVGAGIYTGGFSNEYGYTAAMNGIWYILLFARKEVSENQLAEFKKLIEEKEGRSFDKWRRFRGQTPKGPKLFHKGLILTGTMAGFVEPALGFGITGALLSGKISAMAVYDRPKAEKDFKHFTNGIVTHIERKRQKGYAPSVEMQDVWFKVQ